MEQYGNTIYRVELYFWGDCVCEFTVVATLKNLNRKEILIKLQRDKFVNRTDLTEENDNRNRLSI